MTKVATINGKQVWAATFRNLNVAKRWSSNCTESKMIIMGDDGEFWMVRPVDGNRLIAAGYEVAR